MAMQPKAWITQFLFSNWITHFINGLSTRGGISSINRHLLIVDGHNSHITLEVVMKAMKVGLDLVTLPSHTSHRIQPLDVSIFAPFKKAFKKAFKRYRDAWVLRYRGKDVEKQVLAMWISTGLKRALTKSNIQTGFLSHRHLASQSETSRKICAIFSTILTTCKNIGKRSQIWRA